MRCPDCKHDNIEGVEVCANCGRDLAGLDIPEAEMKPGTEFVYEPLANLPQRPINKVNTTDPVGMAVRHMQHDNADCVLVMNGGALAGIVTLWDILHKIAGAGRDLNAVTCGQIMTADPVFLREDDNIAVAINKMSVGGFRHIPLLEGETPVTVISISDVFENIAPHLA
jgi:CBS domain-containing protein